MKVRDVIKLVQGDGWYEIKRSGGSHRQFKHPVKKGRVTIAGHASEEMPRKTLRSVLTQAGLR